MEYLYFVLEKGVSFKMYVKVYFIFKFLMERAYLTHICIDVFLDSLGSAEIQRGCWTNKHMKSSSKIFILPHSSHLLALDQDWSHQGETLEATSCPCGLKDLFLYFKITDLQKYPTHTTFTPGTTWEDVRQLVRYPLRLSLTAVGFQSSGPNSWTAPMTTLTILSSLEVFLKRLRVPH